MAWDAGFEDLMPHTVSVQLVTGRDTFNKRTYGTATSYKARVLQKHERVVDAEGKETLASTIVWIAPASGSLPDMSSDSKITLPDGTSPPIMRVEVVPDEDGPHHIKCFLGRAERIN